MKTSRWFPIALGALFVFGFFILAVRLFHIQVSDVAEFSEGQTLQATRKVRVPGRRGRILDCYGRILADCRPSHCIRCRLEDFRAGADASATNVVAEVGAAIDRLAAVLGMKRTTSPAAIARHLRISSAMPLTVFQDVGDGAFARFCERADEFPGFERFTVAERTYPNGPLAAHVLGYTGRGNPETDPDDPAHFHEPELRGRSGVEAFYDAILTGTRGEMRITVDALGFRPKRRGRTPDDSRSDEQAQWIVRPSPGMDLTLTIDADLQQVVERQLDGITGACVVLDPRDGAVLAMASAPAFNPNDCVPRLSAAMFASLTNAPAKRGQNRAVNEAYAPGSTFKPITALAALKAGWPAEDEHVCDGVYRLGDLRLHCRGGYGHGSIGLRQAIEQSCNAFFCKLGAEFGTNAVISAARAFGLGAATRIDLAGEAAGVVPDDAWKRRNYGDPWFPGDVCQMSIGQGMLLATPLQMAVVAATLANGGKVYQPFLHRPDVAKSPRPVRRIPFSQADIELVRLGMRDVAEKGTGKAITERRERVAPESARWRRFRLNSTCAGKTGTAEIGQGKTKRKNTWVIAFAPYESPTLAVAMVVERGDTGGKTVAPKINAILASRFGETEIGTIRPASPAILEGRD